MQRPQSTAPLSNPPPSCVSCESLPAITPVMSASVTRIVLRALSQHPKNSRTSRSISTLAQRVNTHSSCPTSTLAPLHHSCSTAVFHHLLHSAPSALLHRAFSAPAKRSVPTLNATLRRFYFLVHPDLFHSHPHHRAINEQNMQHFLGFITAMKQTNNEQPWPPAQHTNLTFYVRRRDGDRVNTSLSFIEYNEQRDKKHSHINNSRHNKRRTQQPSTTDGDFHVLQLTLSTNGGNCRGPVERQLRHLFAMLGLPEEFRWDDEYWQQKPPVKRGSGEAEGQEDEYEYA